MTDTDSKPLGEFSVSTRTFYLTGRELKIIRGWSRPLAGSEGETAFSVSIHGTALGDRDDVCVIGTNHRSREFDLTIRPDRNAQQSWQRIKELSLLAYGDKHSDSPERRIRDLQYELLDKSPPTATLFMTDDNRESGRQSHWSLECEIAETILEQLVADIAARRVDTISIGIEWAAGLIEADAGEMAWWRGLSEEPWNDPLFGTFVRQRWGLFKLPEADSPEPLLGHVSMFRWMLGTERAPPQRPLGDKLTQVHDEWIESITKLREDAQGEPWMDRSRGAMTALAMRVVEWHHEHEEPPRDLRVRLDRAQEFVQRLDGALHMRLGPFADERWSLWEHRRLVEIYRNTKASDRENFIELSELGDLMTEYLSSPHLHEPYLDWIMLDGMTSGHIVSTLEPYMKVKHGIAYSLSDGVAWKMFLWKLVLRSLAFLFGWGLPAVICYFIADWSVPGAITLGVIWYAFKLSMVAVRLWFKLSHLWSGKPTQRQLIDEAEKVYALLAGPVMHVRTVRTAFERSAEKGVNWDQQVFYILDHLAKENPRVWDNRASPLFPFRDGSYRPR